MNSKQAGMASLAALALGMMAPATASAQADEQIRTELDALRAEVAELREQHAGYDSGDGAVNTWPFKAGYDDGFFLADEDDNFRLDISGQIQLRYYQNFRNDPDDGYESTGSFQHRRTRLSFAGHVGSPRFTYEIKPEIRRADGRLAITDFYFGYKFDNGVALKAGRFTSPFFSEDLQSSSRQLTVERSLVNAVFSQGYSTGVQFSASPTDALRLSGMINNGFDTSPEDFTESIYDDVATVGVTGRAEYRVLGDWSQYRHFAAWDGDPMGLFLGGAAHWESRRAELGGRWDDTRDFFSWTADARFHADNLALYGAVVGRHALRSTSGDEYDDLGFIAQAGYTIHDKFQPFVRFEHIKPDSGRDLDDVSLVTAGANWFIDGHNVKLTSDVVYALDSLSGFVGGSGGLGLLDDAPGEDGQFVWRTQFQLLF